MSDSNSPTAEPRAAILFEPDGYVLDGPKLMGRQAAGHAFLRAAVEGRGGQPVAGVTPSRASADVFAKLVQSFDASAESRWVAPARLDQLAAIGCLYVPGPVLADRARLRLRAGPAAFSLVGVTHTTASHTAMDAIASLVSGPVMAWDALVCTSQSVLETVTTVLDAEADFLSWRLAAKVDVRRLALPVIPLGVHTRDFAFRAEERAAARAALGISPDTVVALFVGRLSFHGKAHPHAMYVALEAAALRTKLKLALVQCGWFANSAIEAAFKTGAAEFAPSVPAIFADGRDEAQRRRAWAAADIFISLSDNIQETFGITPVEAMAAGLPVIATDWDGYRETVRDGVDGYLIQTTMPPAGTGDGFAMAHEAGQMTYDRYCGATCRTVAVDLEALTDRVSALVSEADLRARMGAAGRSRARETFDWAVIYGRYVDLYAELRRVRAAALKGPSAAILSAAPRVAPARLDPYRTFAHYATRNLAPETIVGLSPGATAAEFAALSRHAMFAYMPETLPKEGDVAAIVGALAGGPRTLSALAQALSRNPRELTYETAILLKMGIVRVAS